MFHIRLRFKAVAIISYLKKVFHPHINVHAHRYIKNCCYVEGKKCLLNILIVLVQFLSAHFRPNKNVLKQSCTVLLSFIQDEKLHVTTEPPALQEPYLKDGAGEEKESKKISFFRFSLFRGIRKKMKKKIYLLEKKRTNTSVCA